MEGNCIYQRVAKIQESRWVNVSIEYLKIKQRKHRTEKLGCESRVCCFYPIDSKSVRDGIHKDCYPSSLVNLDYLNARLAPLKRADAGYDLPPTRQPVRVVTHPIRSDVMHNQVVDTLTGKNTTDVAASSCIRSDVMHNQVVAIATAALEGFKNEAKTMVTALVDMERVFVPPQHFILQKEDISITFALHAGFLLKKSAKTNGLSRRWFGLNERTGKLGYTKKQEERNFRGVITLEECAVEEIEEAEPPPSKSSKDKKKVEEKPPSLVVKITSKVAYKTVLKAHSAVLLKAESTVDKAEWLNKLRVVMGAKGGEVKLKPYGPPIRQTHSDGALMVKDEIFSCEETAVCRFSDIEVVQMAELQSFGIKAKKPTWKFGSSFFLKKTVKSLPKVLIDDDMDLIDEDNLLLKPQLPPALKIQSHYLGWLSRSCFLKQKQAVMKLQRFYWSIKCLRNFRRNKLEFYSTMVIQSHKRGWIACRVACIHRCQIVQIQLVDEKGAFTAKGGHDKDSKCFPMLYMPQDLLTVIKAKKPTWKLGSSFSLKKTVKSLPKVLIDDDMDLIDEDSLLSEEDLKKPQLSDQQYEIFSCEETAGCRFSDIEVVQMAELQSFGGLLSFGPGNSSYDHTILVSQVCN
ncbi:Dynamin [Artemisia annua]|uniref:Dynamin n=1 Tax=Artemisia annua TaxID=35608 RepID=A0A2U1KR72_ARTAN|nr:Dynamin [Artemisia annua]